MSTGLGAAALQLGINYFQISIVLGQLVEAGYSATALTETLQSGQYNTAWLNVISQAELSQLLTSYYMSMVGASGALYGILVAFCFLVSPTQN